MYVLSPHGSCLVTDMWFLSVVVLCGSTSICHGSRLDFPPWFKFGTATAAYQVEGAWNVSDKGESIWDRFTHTQPERIVDVTNGDVACDSYHHWKEDVRLVADLNLQFYRFSISWVRLLPNGFTNRISEDGKTYYNNIINELLANGIEPVITLYHWELPQRLQDLGGWSNPLVADWFADYADVVFSLYGDRVKVWLTLNEPIAVCDVSFSDGLLAPRIHDPEHGMYLCNKNVLLAHAKAWRLYDTKYRPMYGGQIAINNHIMWYEGVTEAEQGYAELALDFCVGRYSHPIYSETGGWPPAIETIMAEKSVKEGYRRSRLPAFTDEERELIKGTYDFYAINYYTSRTVRKAKPSETLRPWFTGDSPELGLTFGSRPEWDRRKGVSKLYTTNPPGLRQTLVWLKQRYSNVDNFMIMENGFSNTGSLLNDDERIYYMREHLQQILLAIQEDKVNVTRYTYWSLLDNFEWMDGYSTKFGLYQVDFASPLRTRTARKSAHYYAGLARARSLAAPARPASWADAPEPPPTPTSGSTFTHRAVLMRGWMTVFVAGTALVVFR